MEIGKKIIAEGNSHSQEIFHNLQNMIDDHLGMFMRQIERLLGNSDWLVRKIVKMKIGYKLYIYRRCQFISIAMMQKRIWVAGCT